MTSISSVAIEGLEPVSVWKAFEKLSSVPRCSGNENDVQQMIASEAQKAGLKYRFDEHLNLLVELPAQKGYENSPSICIQGHTDMVCEKNSDAKHDFTRDPITLIRDGEFIRSEKTTLGADNGLGVAAMMALIHEKVLAHPRLELLFTVDEERGLTGARNLKDDFLQSKILINTDTEEDAFFIGCAGGADSLIRLPAQNLQEKNDILEIHLEGFRGGHSGIDIHRGRGNAILCAARLLSRVALEMEIHVGDFYGGDKRNAIPREAHVLFSVSQKEAAIDILNREWSFYLEEFGEIETQAALHITERKDSLSCMDVNQTWRLLSLLQSLPSGPLRYDIHMPDLVETSSNVSSIVKEGEAFLIICNTRSSITTAIHSLQDKMDLITRSHGAVMKRENLYPGWKPDPDSMLVKTAKTVYESLFGNSPHVKAVHAGLETGVIKDRYPDMEMISIGPDINYPHSPDERVQIDSVHRFWRLLTGIIESLR